MRTKLQAVLTLVLVATLALPGCATVPPKSDAAAYAAYKEANDPLEPMNREIHGFNMFLERIFWRPLGVIYNNVLPKFVRKRITALVHNLNTPNTLVHDLLQGEPKRASTSLGRFLVNSTVGIGGLFDPAEDMGLEWHTEDLGQTLAVWGIPDGPYLVLPILGSSNIRDGGASLVSSYLDPLHYGVEELEDHTGEQWIGEVITITDGVDIKMRTLENFKRLERTSIDFYATLRSAYRQNRRKEIRNDRYGLEEDIDLFEDFEDF